MPVEFLTLRVVCTVPPAIHLLRSGFLTWLWFPGWFPLVRLCSRMSNSSICLSSLRGLPCVFPFLMDLRIVDFFSLFSFFVCLLGWSGNFLAPYIWNWKRKAHLTFHSHFFTGNDCVCTILSLLEFSIFQIILFYTVWVMVYRVLSPYLQLCKVLSLITVLSLQQPCKVDVIVISQTGTISEMSTLLVRIHTTAKWKCRSERVFFPPLDLRRIINFQSTLLLLCSDLQQFLL